MLEDFLNKEKTISGSHYSGEIEKKEDETRYDALKSYTRQAKMDYQSYIDKGQPEDVEEHFSDEQIKRIKEYNWLETFKTKEGLVSNFRMKMKKAAKLQGSIRRFEKLEGTKDFNKKELAKLMAEYLKTKQNIDEMVQGAGHVLEYAHRFIVNKEKKYYHEFKPLQRLERHLTKLLKKPVGLTSSLHEIYDKKMKNLVNLDKLKGLISNSEEARNISEKRENIKKEALFWSDVRDAERHIANDLYETQGYNKDEEFKEYVKQHSVHIEDEELIKEMEDFLSKGVKKEVKDKEDFVSKEHLKETLRNISKELNETWKDERIVRKRCYKEIIDNMIAQDKSGDQVLETPRIIKLMNDISETESVHTETPVGAVLVGPPGTGKSLGIEHYLATDPEHRTKPSPVIIDMSQETSEYVLLGGEQVDLSDKASTVKHLNSLVKERESIEFDIKNEEDEDTKRLFEQQLDTLNKHLEDIIHFSLGVDLDKMKEQVDFKKDYFEKDNSKEDKSDKEEDIQKQIDTSLDKFEKEAEKQGIDKEEMSEIIKQAMHKWEAEELSHVMFGNGWRYGAMSKAVKEGRDIIINEFNNFKNPPDAIRQLLQTPIGDEWYFTAEHKSYTMNSHIYMTANIDSKYFYDVARLAAPIAARLPKMTKIEYPDPEEELMIAQAKLSDGLGVFLLNNVVSSELLHTTPDEDLKVELQIGQAEKIAYIINKIIPRLRNLADEYPEEIPPIGLRKLNLFCRELVDKNSREPIKKTPDDREVTVEDAFVEYYLDRFGDEEEAWSHLIDSGIVEDMYKDGFFHTQNPSSPSYKFIRRVVADKNNIDIDGAMSRSARQEQMVKIEDFLQGYDKELIEELQKDPDWENAIKKAKEKRDEKVRFFSPEVSQEKMSNTFDKNSERPEAR